MTSPRVQVFADREALSQAAAREFVRCAREAIAARGRFFVALSGGSTPRRLYQLLAAEPYRSHVDWSRVEFFWGDERCVPPDHPESNYRMAREAMLAQLPVPAEHVHRMLAERGNLDAAAREYQDEMARAFGSKPGDVEPPAFDLVLLGMGPDGHTASLFPGTDALREATRWVAPNRVPQLATDRLTLTLPVLNRAREVLFLVAGADKTDRLVEVLTGPADGTRLPSQLIQPAGRLLWFIDQAAAARLPRALLEDKAMNVKLAPSILAADFARLGEQVREAEQAGADRIHVDVMDGHFVPNISMGPVVVKALRPITRLPLEVHLMIEEPDRYLEAFAEAGADSMLVHVENAVNLHRTVQHVKHLGKRAGVVLNPATSPVAIAEILPDANLVLVMTVNPGFGGQKFIPNTLGKVRRIRQMIDQLKADIELEVDGGIDPETAPQVIEAGARVLVAGSAVFGAREGVTAAMGRLRSAAGA
jgi:ribulose-phosphate 3-epimerase